MKSPSFSSVEDYLTSQDPAKEKTLRSVIELVSEASNSETRMLTYCFSAVLAHSL